MQSFGNSKIVMDNIDQLYAYLKGRSDGAITRAKVEEMQVIARTLAARIAGGSRRWRSAARAAPCALLAAQAAGRAAPRTRAARLPGPEQPAVLERRRAKASRTRSPSCSARRWACRSTYYSFPQRLAFVRNTLRYKLPGEDYPLRHRDRRAGGLRPGVGHQALLPLDLCAGLPEGQGPGRASSRSSDFLALDPAQAAGAAHRPLRPLAGSRLAASSTSWSSRACPTRS